MTFQTAATPSSTFESPLTSRYASKKLSHLFSAEYKHRLWRKLWYLLAKGQHELGLPITKEQLLEIEQALDLPIDFAAAEAYEKRVEHDVMAHLLAFGDLCPKARSILHLGATSCVITDNAEILILRDALLWIEQLLLQSIDVLSKRVEEYRALPCLAFTHFQPAQPTTLGKRMCMWLQDLILDLEDIQWRKSQLKLLGLKGATGTQASFLQLFKGDESKVHALEENFCRALGFQEAWPISGQTYTRKLDIHMLDLLAGIGASTHKMASDIRLLAHRRELEEGFGKEQVGSTAMPYKRNPMRSERICSLARYVLSLSENPKYTAANQWLERTLDDSANRRLCIPEAFLATDAIFHLCLNCFENMEAHPKIIEENLRKELPFMATEAVLMASVQKGGDRQELHEVIRSHSQIVAKQMREKGSDNHLVDLLANDPKIPLNTEELKTLLDPSLFIGRAPGQVDEFLQHIKERINHENS